MKTHPWQLPAADRKKLERLASRPYRNSYLETQVKYWLAYQFLALRNKLGLTQEQMAERTGKTQSMISRLESPEYGKVSVQTLLEVASHLNVALSIQFVSYPEFLVRTRDKSEGAMQPETIEDSLRTLATAERKFQENSVLTQSTSAYRMLSSVHQEGIALTDQVARASKQSEFTDRRSKPTAAASRASQQ